MVSSRTRYLAVQGKPSVRVAKWVGSATATVSVALALILTAPTSSRNSISVTVPILYGKAKDVSAIA